MLLSFETIPHARQLSEHRSRAVTASFILISAVNYHPWNKWGWCSRGEDRLFKVTWLMAVDLLTRWWPFNWALPPFVTSKPDKWFDNCAFFFPSPWLMGHSVAALIPLTFPRMSRRCTASKPDTFRHRDTSACLPELEIKAVARSNCRGTLGLIYSQRQKCKQRKQSHLPPSSVATVC